MGAPDKPFRLGELPAARKLQTRCGVLEYVLSGEARPAIVLFNGAGMALEGWRALYPRIERVAATLAWNRFGVQGSDAPPRHRQTGALVVASVRELLSYTAIDPPYVLVGHSLGGLYANLFARLHPKEVAGVLMIEATHPRDDDVLHMDEGRLARSLSKVLSLPDWLFRDNLHAEIAAVGHLAREVEAAGPFPDVPVTVVTGGTPPPKWLMPDDALQARLGHQRDLAKLSVDAEHLIAPQSGHFPQLTEPRLVLDALERLLTRVRQTA